MEGSPWGGTCRTGTLDWPQGAGLAEPSALNWAANPGGQGLPEFPCPTGQPGCEQGPSLPHTMHW